MQYDFITATILLLLIIDPLGNIPICINALRNVAAERRVWVVLREVGIAFVTLLIFMLMGEHFLRLMHLTDTSLQLAGAIILFIIALRMVFPAADDPMTAEIIGEPLIVPLAIPALAGPSAMATVMLLSSQGPGQTMEWIGALTVTMGVCAFVLILADRIQRFLGPRAVIAIERLMGLVLIAISVEMLLAGTRAFIRQL
ncbi:MarC family protein [Mycoavidus sp. SF9855]|uniref:MarC family protein n=1 Tax=Mycoavidus sp. SF9855 TaxID=2968475 RepID=UPI00211C6D74|nr:MarC family protein [Mycoavidus sp. SF9855]UUM21941.1 MarC family protein [Mycoavidus sp. SF9855]